MSGYAIEIRYIQYAGIGDHYRKCKAQMLCDQCDHTLNAVLAMPRKLCTDLA